MTILLSFISLGLLDKSLNIDYQSLKVPRIKRSFVGSGVIFPHILNDLK